MSPEEFLRHLHEGTVPEGHELEVVELTVPEFAAQARELTAALEPAWAAERWEELGTLALSLGTLAQVAYAVAMAELRDLRARQARSN